MIQSDNANIIKSKQILKNLNAILKFSIERYNHQFVWQEIELKDEFKSAFRDVILKKGGDISFYKHTSIFTSPRNNQYIFIANQWFAIGSYFVDFCTELLTYQQYFFKICNKLYISGKDNIQSYAIKLKTSPSVNDKEDFKVAALEIFNEDFDAEKYDIQSAVSFLWKFVSNYSWWAGSKYISRGDFYISAILNSLNVVNANAEFLAEIVCHYASNLDLRLMVQSLEGFTIDVQTNDYTPSEIEKSSYNEAEVGLEKIPLQKVFDTSIISISAASLQRFKSGVR